MSRTEKLKRMVTGARFITPIGKIIIKDISLNVFEEMNTGECGKTTSDTGAVVITITRERYIKIFSCGT